MYRMDAVKVHRPFQQPCHPVYLLASMHVVTSDLLAQVKTIRTGEIDYDHFREVIYRNKDRPAIVNVNIGTTVKGAVDDLDKILDILEEVGYTEDRFYIHCDGALFGLMV